MRGKQTGGPIAGILSASLPAPDDLNADWEGLLPPEQRSSGLVMIAAAGNYFDMFAAEPTVHPPFATPCDGWKNGAQTTAERLFTLEGEESGNARP